MYVKYNTAPLNVMFFSQTGTECLDLIRELNLNPLLITNMRPENVRTINQELLETYPILYLQNNPTVHSYEDVFEFIGSTPIESITLHGWLRIVPEEICSKYQIFNGHPAYLVKYPELKGKDQQEVPLNRQREYPIIGSVIHKVDPIVDNGMIISGCYTNNTAQSLDEIYGILKQCSYKTWVHFFTNLREGYVKESFFKL